MTTPIILKITEAGKTAILDGEHIGIGLRLNQLAIGNGQYTPTGNETTLQGEISRHGIVSGNVEPQTHTLRFSSSIKSDTEIAVYEIGLMTEGNVLFAVASSTDKPLLKVYPDITFVASFGITLDSFDISKVTVANDPNGALSIVLMQQHLSSPDPHPQYALRKYVNEQIQFLLNRPFEGIPVHGILATTKHYQSGDEVTADLRYGKWARYAQGKILAGYSLLASDIPEYKTMGNEFGENSHTLTVAEMPKHNHGSNMRFEAGEAILVDAELATKVDSGDMLDHMNEDTTASTNTTYSGNNQPHNNLQPAVVVAFWVRMPDNYVEPTYRLYWSSDENGNNVITQIKEGATVYLWLEADNLLNNITLDPVASGVFLTNLANMPQVHKDLSITQVKNGKQKALQFDTTQIGITSDSQAIASVVFSGNHLANTLLISNDTGNDIDPNTINSTIVLDLDNHTATSSDSRIVLRDFYVLDGELSQINFKTEKDFLLNPSYNYSTQSVIYNKPVADFPKTDRAIKDSVFEITGIKPNGENMVVLTRKENEPQPTASGDAFDIYAQLFSDDYVQNYPNLSIILGGYSRIPRSGKYTINVKIGRWLQLDGQSQA